jgi:hypothetical protein
MNSSARRLKGIPSRMLASNIAPGARGSAGPSTSDGDPARLRRLESSSRVSVEPGAAEFAWTMYCRKASGADCPGRRLPQRADGELHGHEAFDQGFPCFGIDVRVHATFIFIVAYFAYLGLRLRGTTRKAQGHATGTVDHSMWHYVGRVR